jgi:hypothetical protein
MSVGMHALTQEEGLCACGWKSHGTSAARRQAGLRRHLGAARSRGETVIDQAVAGSPSITEAYDQSQADIPAGAAIVFRAFLVLLGPLGGGVIALTIPVLVFMALHYARVQIPGVLFAAVSLLVVLVVTVTVGALVEISSRELSARVFGQPIASPKAPRTRLLQLAMRSAQSIEYAFPADVQAAVDRFEVLDLLEAERKAAAGDGDARALLAFTDRRTGKKIRDILQVRSLELATSMMHFRALGSAASRLSELALASLATLSILEADDRLDRVRFVQIGIGLVLLSALLVILFLQVRLSAAQLVGLEKLEYMASDADRTLINRIKKRWLYPSVTVKPEFYSVLRRLFLLLHVPIVAVNLFEVGLIFLCVALVTLLWPGGVKDWTGELPRAFALVSVAAVLYVGAFWAVLKLLESLRDVLQPVFVAIVTAAGAVLVIYLFTGSFDARSAAASVGSALPAAIATGFASGFWKNRSH